MQSTAKMRRYTQHLPWHTAIAVVIAGILMVSVVGISIYNSVLTDSGHTPINRNIPPQQPEMDFRFMEQNLFLPSGNSAVTTLHDRRFLEMNITLPGSSSDTTTHDASPYPSADDVPQRRHDVVMY